MTRRKADLLQGTLDLLVLKTLCQELQYHLERERKRMGFVPRLHGLPERG